MLANPGADASNLRTSAPCRVRTGWGANGHLLTVVCGRGLLARLHSLHGAAVDKLRRVQGISGFCLVRVHSLVMSSGDGIRSETHNRLRMRCEVRGQWLEELKQFAQVVSPRVSNVIQCQDGLEALLHGLLCMEADRVERLASGDGGVPGDRVMSGLLQETPGVVKRPVHTARSPRGWLS